MSFVDIFLEEVTVKIECNSLNKGKPTEKLGRKASGLIQLVDYTEMVAGLPGMDLPLR